ncbi:hypothetical protein ST47_g1758 [Ascochyta rabiei]|uniref:Uncharacterized protein n=1 Tax=Didymella rabiei TaxID=5454 RepID=A0A163KM77_DIDRA|nr:hypothetical protein ST47_g1758 [Ascochyta rabiei]
MSFPPSVSHRVTSPRAQVTTMGSIRSAGSQELTQLALPSGSPHFEPQKPSTVPTQSPLGSRMATQTLSLPNTLTHTTPHDAFALPSSQQADDGPIMSFQPLLAPINTCHDTALSDLPASNIHHAISNSKHTLLAPKHLCGASSLNSRLQESMRPAGDQTSNSADNVSLSPATGLEVLEEFDPTEDDEHDYIVQDYDDTPKHFKDSVHSLLRANPTPSQVYDAQSAALPCMSCGIISTHESQCWIKEAALCLKVTTELSVLEYRELAASVQRFDPGPWTTHVGPPIEVELDDPHTQVQVMAEIIRNLNTNAENPILQTQNDQLMSLFWALSSSGSVRNMEAPGESDREEWDVPDAW